MLLVRERAVGPIDENRRTRDPSEHRPRQVVIDAMPFSMQVAIAQQSVHRLDVMLADLRLRTLYTVKLLCAPGRSVVLVEEGLRGRLEDVASKAVESARVSERWRVRFRRADLRQAHPVSSRLFAVRKICSTIHNW